MIQSRKSNFLGTTKTIGNKVYLYCDRSIGMSAEELFGTGFGIADKVFNIPQVFRNQNTITIKFPLRELEFDLLDNEPVLDQIVNHCINNESRFTHIDFVCYDKSALENIQQKGFENVTDNATSPNFILCEYNEQMKYYAEKLKLFSIDPEYHANKGGRVLYL